MRISAVSEAEFASGHKSNNDIFHNKNDKKKNDSYLRELERFTNVNRESFVDQIAKSGQTTSSNLVFNSRPFSKIKRAKQLSSHVGFNFSNKDMIFVENNAVSLQVLERAKKEDAQPSKAVEEKNIFGNSNMFYNGDIKSLRLIGPPSESNRVNKMLNEDKFKQQAHSIEELKTNIKENDKISSNYLNFVDKNRMDDNDMITYYKAKRRQITDSIKEINNRDEHHQNKLSDLGLNFSKQSQPSSRKGSPRRKMMKSASAMSVSKNKSTMTQKESSIKENEKALGKQPESVELIRALFPFVDPSIVPKINETYVIGSGELDRSGKDTIRLNLLKRNQSTISMKTLQKSELEDARRPGIVRCASSYETIEDRRSREYLQSKDKWVSKKEFKRHFAKKEEYISNYVNLSPYRPPSQHAFRDTSKSRWLGAKDFSVV